MCGRYTLVRLLKVLEVLPGVELEEAEWAPRYNIAPMQEVAVTVSAEAAGGGAGRGGGGGAGKLKVEKLRWGLIPFWAKDAEIGSRMINARAESLAEKAVFRKPLERRRCLVWADGFYEWQRVGGDEDAEEEAGRRGRRAAKLPMYVRMKDGLPFAFAGLWETWKNPEGAELRTCVIITTGPNELMKPIHDRMPAILPREKLLGWLEPRDRTAEEMVQWLAPYPAEEMEAWEVGRAVNSAANEGEELVRRVGGEMANGRLESRKRKEDEPGLFG